MDSGIFEDARIYSPLKKRMGYKLWSLVLVLLIGLLLGGCTPGNVLADAKGWSATVEKDGVVYVGTQEGKFLALDAENGRELWRFPEDEDSTIGGAHAPPAVGEELVFLGSYDGKVYAFDRESKAGGVKPAWVASTRGPVVGGLTLVGNKVLVGSEDGKLYALDASTGETVWTFPVRGHIGQIWSTPVVDEEQGRVYFGSMDHFVYSVRLSDGQLDWQFETGGAVSGTPLLVDGLVVVGSFDRFIYALDPGNSGQPSWKFRAENWFWASPVYDGSTIFAAALDGKVYALSPASGHLKWDFDLESPVVSTPLITGDGLAVASDSGRLHLLYTNLSGEQEKWFYDIGVSVRAPLTGSGAALYLGDTDGMVRRINITGGSREEWKISTKR